MNVITTMNKTFIWRRKGGGGGGGAGGGGGGNGRSRFCIIRGSFLSAPRPHFSGPNIIANRVQYQFNYRKGIICCSGNYKAQG